MTTPPEPTGQSERDHWQLVLATSEVGVWELDIQSGAAWRNLRHDQIFGYRELQPSWTYDMFLGHVLAADRTRVDGYYRDAIDNRCDWAFECRIRRPNGEIRWISVKGRPLTSPAGNCTKLIGHVLDITDTKRTEEHLRLISGELNHRVRNMLTMVKALVQVTADNAADVRSFAQAMEDRLAALSRAQDMLQPQQGAAIRVVDIIRNELAVAQDVGGRVRIQLEGVPALDRTAAERFALVVHELMTNAIKHGALSHPGGQVLIEGVAAERDRMRLEWREVAGRPVSPPTRKGFGSLLLDRALGDRGDVSLDFRHDGLVCVINLVTVGAEGVPNTPKLLPEPPVRDAGTDLEDACVLVLEDEPLISMSYESMLEKWKVQVVGPFTSCGAALAAIESPGQQVHAAILDVNLGGETSDAVATRLIQIGVPFVFTTGYGGDAGLNGRYPGIPVLTKPAMPEDLEHALHQLLSEARVAGEVS